MLMNIGNELMERSTELGTLLSREEGKPLAEGKGEIYRAGQFFTYYAAEVLRQIGDTADSVRPNIEIDVRRTSRCSRDHVSPWNFPTATAVWKIAPALCLWQCRDLETGECDACLGCALAEIISAEDARRPVQPCHGRGRQHRSAVDREPGD